MISDLGEAAPHFPDASVAATKRFFFLNKLSWVTVENEDNFQFHGRRPLPADIMLIFYFIFQKYL